MPDPIGGIAGGALAAGSTEDIVRAQYGYLAAFLDDPEIGPILRQAAEEGWDASRLQGSLYKTNWWQTHSQASRQFDALLSTDPAEAERLHANKINELSGLAQRAGLEVDWGKIGQIAYDALRGGWSDQQMRQALVSNASTVNAYGDIAQIGYQTRALAADYMVPVTDENAADWGKRIMQGTLTMDGLKAWLTDVSKSRFPHLAQYIDQGVSPSQFFQPYKQAIASELEVSPDSIDFMGNNKWTEVVSHNDEKSGIRPMTVSEAVKLARSQPEYQNTAGARQKTADLGEFITRTFGKVA